jgi:hypothetical protein
MMMIRLASWPRRLGGAAILVAALAAILVLAPAAAGVAEPAAIAGHGYRLVKDWDFSRMRSPEELRAEFHTRFKNDGGTLDKLNDEWQRYSDDGNHVLADGVLKLVAKVKGGLHNGGIESGLLRSKWTGKYGYFEARVKVPSGLGLWSAFWLVADDGLWPPEIDVFEILDNGRDTTRRSFHNLAWGKIPTELVSSRLDRWGAYAPPFDYKDGFHTIAVEWTPDRVRHFVDDVMVADRRAAWTHEDGRDAGAAHILLNLAVGGRWPGPPAASSLPAALEVAYLRVWQKP